MTSAKFVRLVRPGRFDRSSNRTPSPSSSFLNMNNITVVVLFSLFIRESTREAFFKVKVVKTK